jgi:hypothetical protein
MAGVLRAGLAAAGFGGKVYVVGGWDGEEYLDSLEIFDCRSRTYRLPSCHPAPSLFHVHLSCVSPRHVPPSCPSPLSISVCPSVMSLRHVPLLCLYPHVPQSCPSVMSPSSGNIPASFPIHRRVSHLPRPPPTSVFLLSSSSCILRPLLLSIPPSSKCRLTRSRLKPSHDGFQNGF